MRIQSFKLLQKLSSKKSLPHLNKSVFRGIQTSRTLKNVTETKTTIDAAHVERHSQLANDWWNPNGSMVALHSFNLIRVPFVRDGLVSCPPNERTSLPLSDKVILDVGCGGGILSEAISRLGAKVTGIDASKELIELATEHSSLDPKIRNYKPSYHCTTIEEHSHLFPEHYDAVVASEVIEHVADKELFLQSCVKAVKPGGKIFITAPNRSRLTQVFGIIAAEYIMKVVPKGTHEYDKLPTANEVTFILERNNCHVQLIHGMMYYPVLNKWTWASSTAFLFALQAVKLNE